MKVKLAQAFLVIALSLYASQVNAFCFPQLGNDASAEKTYSLHFSYLPLGIYSYVADDDGAKRFFGGRFHEASLEVEYKPVASFGFEAYTDFKGYFYRDDGGYSNSDNSFVRFWGLPNFKVGAGIAWYPFRNSSKFDFSISYGIEYAHYIVDDVNSFPGIGMSLRLQGIWKVTSNFGLGVTGATHYSTHKGGPYKDDPDRTRLPFELAELGLGLTGIFFF